MVVSKLIEMKLESTICKNEHAPKQLICW
jgi:hypothetical protein